MTELRAHPANAPLLVRSTTGRPLTIRYDAASNAIAFDEADWHADGFRLGHETRPIVSPRRHIPFVRRGA